MTDINIRSALIGGTFWIAVGRYSQSAVSLGVTAVLARLLDPSDFGVLAMVVVYTGFVTLLAEAGIGATVIQKRELDDKALSTAFWFVTLLSLTFAIFTIIIAPFIEAFFAFPGLALVVQVMSITLLLAGMGSVPDGRLRRALRFKQVAAIEIVSPLLSGVVAIFLAFEGAGYWALVFQVIIAMIIRLIGLLAFNRWLPQFVFEVQVLRQILGFSGYVVGFNGVNYWARNADKLLIGRFLDAIQLGLYDLAYKLMMLPMQLITSIVNSTLHPVFSSIQDDLPRMRNAYLQVLKPILGISFLLAAFMFIWASEIVMTVFGPNWESSIPVFQILVIVSGLQLATATTGSVLLATGRAALFFKMGIVSSVIYVIGFLVSVEFGIVAVALSYVVTNFVVCPAVLYVTYKFALNGKITDILRHVLVMLGVTALFIATSALVRVIADNFSDLVCLGFGLALLGLFSLPLFYITAKHAKLSELVSFRSVR